MPSNARNLANLLGSGEDNILASKSSNEILTILLIKIKKLTPRLY